MSKKKIERQSIFLGMAAIMCLLVAGFAVYVVMSMASDLNNALSVPETPPNALKFDIQGFENLKLIR